MERYRRHILSIEAAEKDANLMCKIISDFLNHYINCLPSLPATGHNDISGEFNIIKTIETTCHMGFKDAILSELKTLYSYARADYYNEDFDTYTYCYLDSIYSKFQSALMQSAATVELMTPLNDVVTKDIVSRVCPRIYYAFQVAYARRELRLAITKAKFKNENNISPEGINLNTSVTAISTALLSDVGYTYVIQLIKESKLPAKKMERQWRIPAHDALTLILKYYPNEIADNKIDI